MVTTPDQIRGSAKNMLRTVFERIPGCQIMEDRSEFPDDKGAEYWEKIRKPDGTEQILIAAICSPGHPRFIRVALDRLYRLAEKHPGAARMVIAPYISPQAATLCHRENAGYLDLSGNCRLSLGSVYLERTGSANAHLIRRDQRSLYSPKTTRVLRVLLVDIKESWRLKKLAEAAGVSIGQTHTVKQMLLEREWASYSIEDGLRLTQPELLLAGWAQRHTLRRGTVRNFISPHSIPEAEARIGTSGIRYALTGFSAGTRILDQAPAGYARVMVYSSETTRLAVKLDAKEVLSGGNVTILTPYDDGVWYETSVSADGLVIVSAVQAYLDILKSRGGGPEVARVLMQEVLLPKWEEAITMANADKQTQ